MSMLAGTAKTVISTMTMQPETTMDAAGGCCRERGWPVVIAMAGGYAADYRDIVDIQATTIEMARTLLAS